MTPAHDPPPTTGTPAVQLTLRFTVRHHAGHRSLRNELVRRARRMGLAGMTVLEGVEGYGTSGRLHAWRTFAGDAPVAIVSVDRPERIDAFLSDSRDLLGGVGVSTESVVVVQPHG